MSSGGFVGEIEAYALLSRHGLHPPVHGTTDQLPPFAAGTPVVLKGIGEELWHKSELGAVAFLPFDPAAIRVRAAEMRRSVEGAGHRWLGGLVCERIAIASSPGLPTEALFALTDTEAGRVVVAGIGGMQADELSRSAPALRWPIRCVTAAQALEEFSRHLVGRAWLGAMRGTRPLTNTGALAEFFDRIWELANSLDHEGIALLEMNPVVLDSGGCPRPLDAVGRRGRRPAPALPPAAPGYLEVLRQPRRIALAGVSSQEGGVGRTILENLEAYGLTADDLVLVKPGADRLLGHPCIPNVVPLAANPVDLLMVALPAPAAVELLTALVAQGGGARVVALVSGGIGDGADRDGLIERVHSCLAEARQAGRWTPAVLGPNFLGHWVPESGLNSSFIPTDRLASPPDSGPLTLLSQSGAFLICRRSTGREPRFRLALALGNQLDLSAADMLEALAGEGEPGPVAAYLEGFGPGHLERVAAAIRRLRAQGRHVLIHRAGISPTGQAAAASHTGAIASDAAIERTLLERSGARFSESIAAFDAAIAWLAAYPQIAALPAAVLTNAGCESVRAADLAGPTLPGATLDDSDVAELAALLARHRLDGLVNPRLPLDLTPMSDEQVYLECAEFLLRKPVNLVVGLVPFARRIDISPSGVTLFARALAERAKARGQAVGVAVDAGPDYDQFRDTFRHAGIPVFQRVEDALLGLAVVSGPVSAGTA